MKPIIIVAALAAALSVQAQEAAKTDSVEGFKFTDVKTVKTGPVRDQNKSGTCWCFSSNSFFENEIIRKGHKPVDLSEMFVVWHTYDARPTNIYAPTARSTSRRVAADSTSPMCGQPTA